MSTTDDRGEAVSIVWLPGSSPDLSQREELLVQNARQEGYAAGERHGYKVGGEDAVRAMTTLTSMLNDRRVSEALETLRYFIEKEAQRG